MSSFLLVLLGLFLPTQLGYHFWPSTSFVYGLPIDYLSPTLYLTDLILLSIYVFNFRHLPKPPLVFIALIALNSFFSINSPLTIIFWARIYLLFNLVHFVSKQPPLVLRHFVLSLFTSTLIVSLIAILQFADQSSLGGFTYWLGERTFTVSTPGIARSSFSNLLLLRPYSTFSHPNSLSGYLLVVLLLVISLKKRPKLLHYTTLLLATVTLVLAFSKAVFLSLFILIVSPLVPRRFFTTLFAAFLLSSTLTTAIFKLPQNLASSQFIVDRVLLSRDTLEVFSHKPIFGTGLGTLIQSFGRYGLGIHNSRLLLQPVHNIPLLLLTELGTLGLILLLTTLKPFLKVPKTKLPYLMILAILTTSMFDHYWITLVQNRLLIAVVIGLLINPQIKSILKQ